MTMSQMSNILATNMKWNGSKDELLNIFSDRIDQDVIEAVIDYRNNDVSIAYEDLLEMAKTSNPEQSRPISSIENQNQLDIVTDSSNINCLNWERLTKNETPTNRILYLVSKGYKVMVFMRGCPGSGKSFVSTNILNQCYKNSNANEFIFSTDNYFINKYTGKYKFNVSKLSNAHLSNQNNVQKAVLSEVTPIIIDNTNTQIWEMEAYFKMGVNNGYWIEIIEPSTEWAWDALELSKRNSHNVPYDIIQLMLSRYEHNITVDDVLIRLNLKYNKINQPPKLSKYYKKYQLSENIIDKNNIVNKPTEINDDFKNLHISQNYDVENNEEKKCTSFNNSDEDPWYINGIKEKEMSMNNKLDNTSHNILDIDESNEYHTVSSTRTALNFVHKSVNTYENDFLFMEVLNEIPEEEYRSYVVFGKNININEGNTNILNNSCGQLDKSTTTNDLIKAIYKPNVSELRKQFPENVCLLISELFDKCEGNIDWIVDMLFESGHTISKQQLHNLFQSKDSFVDTIPAENIVENCGQITKNNVFLTSLNTLPIAETFIENKTIIETNSKKKKLGKKVIDLKGKKLQTDDDLKKNIENKFVFNDSLYSEHVLNIKKYKEDSQKILNCNNLISTTISENVEGLVSNINDDEKFVQIVVDTSVLTQLCDYFGDFSSDLSKSTLPMSVKLPEKLAEDLYYCLIANVPTNIFEQEAILHDEILARKLQEDNKQECLSNISNSNTGELTFAAVLSKKLLLEKFKNLDPKFVMNVWRENEFKLQEASDVLSKASGIGCLTTQNNLDIVENDENFINEEKYDHTKNNQNYSQEALEHAHIKQQYINKASQSLSTKIHPAVTGYYLEKAEESKQNEKHAKTRALIDLVKTNENSTTLDLHYFPVQEAVLILDLYLDNHISNLKKFNSGFSRGRQLTIITGRGKHSPKGIARIRPVIVRRLQCRRLMFLEPETPGLIMVIIKKTSFLSSEL